MSYIYVMFGRITWGIIKLALGLVLALSLLGIFWFIFYSNGIANKPAIITIRDQYQTTYWNIKGIFFAKQRNYPPFSPIYTIQPINTSGYSYRFFGKFQNIDLGTGIITFMAFDNKNYKFTVPQVFIDNRDTDIIGIPVGSVVQVEWRDGRSLSVIIQNYSLNPQFPLNIKSNSFSVTKID